ncbi:MAG: hypothetical protein KA436_04510 [Oligoflexales bacterium]|nr:hypothetical protein [Oligoflexales bacterium]
MRTVAIRTDDGGLIVYNPVRNLGQDIHSELAKIGDVRWVISPNHYHTLAADGWQQLYPKAKFFAHLQAHPRLKKQTKVSWLDIVDLIPILPKGVTLKKPRGLKTGEIGLCLERPDIKMWIFGDLFFNIPKLPPGLFGFILRLGGTAPGLHSSRVFRLIAVSDRQDFLQWLQENLAQDRPQCFVPTHGEILFHPALSQRLYDVASANLKRKKNIS